MVWARPTHASDTCSLTLSPTFLLPFPYARIWWQVPTSSSSVDVLRLCIGEVCLQQSASNTANSDGRLFFVRKGTSLASVRISTADIDMDILQVFPYRDGGDNLPSFPTFFFVNQYTDFGIYTGYFNSRHTYGGRLLIDKVCIGESCLRASSTSAGVLMISGKDADTRRTAHFDTRLGGRDIFRVYRDRDGNYPYFYYNNANGFGTNDGVTNDLYA